MFAKDFGCGVCQRLWVWCLPKTLVVALVPRRYSRHMNQELTCRLSTEPIMSARWTKLPASALLRRLSLPFGVLLVHCVTFLLLLLLLLAWNNSASQVLLPLLPSLPPCWRRKNNLALGILWNILLRLLPVSASTRAFSHTTYIQPQPRRQRVTAYTLPPSLQGPPANCTDNMQAPTLPLLSPGTSARRGLAA